MRHKNNETYLGTYASASIPPLAPLTVRLRFGQSAPGRRAHPHAALKFAVENAFGREAGLIHDAFNGLVGFIGKEPYCFFDAIAVEQSRHIRTEPVVDKLRNASGRRIEHHRDFGERNVGIGVRQPIS